MNLQKDNRNNSYKKKAECPEDIAYLIRIANLAPTDAEIPSYGQMFYSSPEERKQIGISIRKDLEMYPALIEHLGQAGLSNMQPILQEFERVRFILKNVVGCSEHYRKKEGNINQREYIINLQTNDFFYLYVNFPGGEYNESKGEGVINFRLSATLEDFNGLGLTRFRRCAICKSYFWAKKDNAETCNQKHAKTLYDQKRAAKRLTAKEAREKWKNQDFSKEVRSKK